MCCVVVGVECTVLHYLVCGVIKQCEQTACMSSTMSCCVVYDDDMCSTMTSSHNHVSICMNVWCSVCEITNTIIIYSVEVHGWLHKQHNNCHAYMCVLMLMILSCINILVLYVDTW